MKKLVALILALVMVCCMLPAMAEGIDTSEHVKIVYLVTGDKPTNRTDEILGKYGGYPEEEISRLREEGVIK